MLRFQVKVKTGQLLQMERHLSVRDENKNLGFIPGTTYDSITGIVQEFDGTYQIIPRGTSDIVGELDQPEVPTEVSTVAEAREAGAGKTVTIEGIATTKNGLWGYDTFYMQDGTAGMFVFSSPKDVQPGDKVKITGKLLTYKNELEIDPSSLEIISSGNTLPEAQVVAPSAVKEDTQGELIKLENITITDLKVIAMELLFSKQRQKMVNKYESFMIIVQVLIIMN